MTDQERKDYSSIGQTGINIQEMEIHWSIEKDRPV